MHTSERKMAIIAMIFLVVIAALYRFIPNRPFGFAPQYSMALFGAAVFRKSKIWAFVLPLASLFLSDLGFQLLYKLGYQSFPGLYSGMWMQYLIWALLVAISFGMQKVTTLHVLLWSFIIPIAFYWLSNFAVWATTTMYPKTSAGLMDCYLAGIPYFKNSILSCLLFSTILFEGYYWAVKSWRKDAVAFAV